MNFLPEANSSEILVMFRAYAGLLGWKAWDLRVDQLKRTVLDNPFAQQLILTRHSIELGYSAIRAHYRATTLPGRLDSHDFEQILSAAGAAAKSEQKIQLSTCSVSVRRLLHDGKLLSRIKTAHADQIREVIESELGVSYPHMLVKASDENAVIAGIRSQKQNIVLERIYRNMIADSKRQFSGKRPGLLMLKLPQISNQEMKDLQRAEGAGPTGIQKTASAILNKRKNLCAVALVPFSEVRQLNSSTATVRTTSVKASGDALIYWNDRCEFPQANAKADILFASPDG